MKSGEDFVCCSSTLKGVSKYGLSKLSTDALEACKKDMWLHGLPSMLGERFGVGRAEGGEFRKYMEISLRLQCLLLQPFNRYTAANGLIKSSFCFRSKCFVFEN